MAMRREQGLQELHRYGMAEVSAKPEERQMLNGAPRKNLNRSRRFSAWLRLRLRPAAAPSLPTEYRRAAWGLLAASVAGSDPRVRLPPAARGSSIEPGAARVRTVRRLRLTPAPA